MTTKSPVQAYTQTHTHKQTTPARESVEKTMTPELKCTAFNIRY